MVKEAFQYSAPPYINHFPEAARTRHGIHTRIKKSWWHNFQTRAHYRKLIARNVRHGSFCSMFWPTSTCQTSVKGKEVIAYWKREIYFSFLATAANEIGSRGSGETVNEREFPEINYYERSKSQRDTSSSRVQEVRAVRKTGFLSTVSKPGSSCTYSY